MAWYEFSQNNSGGSFDYSEASGISHKVYIEAESADDANAHALYVGIYFDGCIDGGDCSCCGDRWSPVYEGEYHVVDDVPAKDSKYEPYAKWDTKWMKSYEYFIHPLEGDFYGAGV